MAYFRASGILNTVELFYWLELMEMIEYNSDMISIISQS